MSEIVFTISEAVQRINSHDPTLKRIFLCNQYNDEEITELLDCLLQHPDTITIITMCSNRLTDKTGIKLARYLAASSTIELLDLDKNQFGETTYLALAAALRVNTSLAFLNLKNNQMVNKYYVDAAFVDALIVNPNRPPTCPDMLSWLLYSRDQDEYPRLKKMAEELGHPNMQALLVMQLGAAL